MIGYNKMRRKSTLEKTRDEKRRNTNKCLSYSNYSDHNSHNAHQRKFYLVNASTGLGNFPIISAKYITMSGGNSGIRSFLMSEISKNVRDGPIGVLRREFG